MVILKRILHVYRLFGRGGAQIRTLNIYQNIDRTKIQFDFIVHTPDKQPCEDEAMALGGNFHRIPPFKIYNWPSYRRTWKKFLSECPQYDAVHIHITNFAFAFLPLLSHIPVRIVHAHASSDISLLKRIIVKITRPALLKHATHFWAVSKLAALFAFGNKQNNIAITPNPIDIQVYRFNEQTRQRVRKELGVENNLVIGHVGRFTTEKNHGYLFKVAKALKDEIPNSVLLSVGYGSRMEEYKNVASQIGLDVKFLGMRKDVPELLQAMDVFVLPSLYEGLGTVAVEAQAAGLPCVVSDTLPEECSIVPSMVTFLPIKNSNIKDWVSTIIKNSEYERVDTYESLRGLGVDIFTQAELETSIY